MENIEYKLVSSLEKCFFDTEISDLKEYRRASALRGERFCYQLVWKSTDPGLDGKHTAFLRIESPLSDYVSAQSVESVSVRFPAYKSFHDDNYLRLTPGLYPDLMIPVTSDKQLYIVYNDTRALWVDVAVPSDVPGGEYPIKTSLVDANGNEFFSDTFNLTVIAADLPKQTVRHTEWFHSDCLANYYNVEVWSEEHWRIIENFIRTAVKNSINMILTPVFTPPLDTAVGGERTTVQLVDVYNNGGKWSFGYSKLGRWIDICQRCGVEYFEISHLFTQWGAGHTPKILATVDGEYKKVFGWETDSLSDEYNEFLQAFLPSLLEFLRFRGVDKNCVFHVSDEPGIQHLERYRAARSIIQPYLEGYVIMDALSNYEFYKTGAIDHPVPCNDHIDAFIEGRVPDLWTYYCCGQSVNVSNRFLAMPSARTRILGTQMYKYNIVGFLQWGYNFYNSQYSIDHINPYVCNDGEYFVPAGDCFEVYPAPDGSTYETLHFIQVSQAFQDIRALQLAENLCGREAVLEAIDGDLDEKITFSHYPHSSEYLLGMREKINAMIAEKI